MVAFLFTVNVEDLLVFGVGDRGEIFSLGEDDDKQDEENVIGCGEPVSFFRIFNGLIEHLSSNEEEEEVFS